jgi:hypothetical protein
LLERPRNRHFHLFFDGMTPLSTLTLINGKFVVGKTATELERFIGFR